MARDVHVKEPGPRCGNCLFSGIKVPDVICRFNPPVANVVIGDDGKPTNWTAWPIVRPDEDWCFHHKWAKSGRH